MAMPAEEIARWIATLPAGSRVGIGEEGMTLAVVGIPEDECYLEIGGIPLPEPTDQEMDAEFPGWTELEAAVADHATIGRGIPGQPYGPSVLGWSEIPALEPVEAAPCRHQRLGPCIDCQQWARD